MIPPGGPAGEAKRELGARRSASLRTDVARVEILSTEAALEGLGCHRGMPRLDLELANSTVAFVIGCGSMLLSRLLGGINA